MPKSLNIPVRNLSQSGIIKDQGSYDLPLTAFTGGRNIRFQDGAVRDAPIWRKALDIGEVQPAYALGVRGTQSFDETFIASKVGRIYRFVDRNFADVSPDEFEEIQGEAPFTGGMLGSVVYINRSTSVPLYKLPSETKFKPLDNWDPTWRCEFMRPHKDFLITGNVTKGAVNNPNLIKWSNLTLQGQVPNTWDSTATENNVAGENPLSDATAPIIDGGTLGDFFMIYTGRESYRMRYVQGAFIFDFQKISGSSGIINANCWVEVQNSHFVFGPNTIYVTDGTSQRSISDGRVTSEIYGTMNKQQARRFFVHHNPALTEVMFCFVSGSDVYFPNPTACNRAAVYNYSNDTWTFYDLPNIAAMTSANMDSRRTWADLTNTWDNFGGTWYDLEHSSLSHPVAVAAKWSDQETGRAIPSSRILALDYLDEGKLTYAMDEACYAPAYVERINMDLDELNMPLSSQKSIRSLMPQVATSRSVPFVAQMGAGLFPTGRQYAAPANFNPTNQYKLDWRVTGRYLNLLFSVAQPAGFKFSGYDLVVLPIARR